MANDPFTVHISPSNCGIGLSHNLIRFWVPPPQLAEQVSHLPHFPQPPFTLKGMCFSFILQLINISEKYYEGIE